MLCQNCGKNEVNVRYTQIINGVKNELRVCEKCAKKLGIGSFEFNMPMHFSNFFGDFFNDYSMNLLPSFVKEINNQCGTYGKMYNDFERTGFFEFPDYCNEFDTKIDSMLKKIHKNNKSIEDKSIENKITKENKDEVNKKESKENKLEKLKKELELAIKDERYEDAAKIRDKIKILEK